ncbi:MAG: protein-methionine-sulfoxide reductase catalytic subunit MsrP [Alphaproteobacteria bacterium]|nr:protein-methionine-sulfoxide reductase catalytic subunit MsrP [Alphaproteobacteria bacterium]
MLVRVKPSWEIPEREITPERLVFNRRNVLKGAGLMTIAGVAAACDRGSPTQTAGTPAPEAGLADAPDPTASLYPVPRNASYTVDRETTAEEIVAGYNNYYEFGVDKDDPAREAHKLPIRPWAVSFEGMVEKPFTADIDTLIKAMPLEERVYRHRCVETWSFIAPWAGFPMKALIDYAKPTSAAKYVVMKSWMKPEIAPDQAQFWVPWPYTEGLSIEEATNDVTFMVTGAYGKPLSKQNGAPLRLATPWKYGFKSTKGIQKFIFTNERPTTYWMALGAREYGFWANVNPQVPHPRWSQASEEVLGLGRRVPTLLYNGYGEQVASLYSGLVNERLFM